MGKSTDVILKLTSDKEGIIYVRTIVDGVQRRKSIKEKILKKDWETYYNPKTKRFRVDKRFDRHTAINDKLDYYFNLLPTYHNDLGKMSDSRKSFIKYWTDLINLENNEGTKIKHKVIFSKLNKYLKNRNRSELLFSEIDQHFVKQLKSHFEKSKDPKKLSTNTVNHYLKVIHSILNKAKKDDYFHYPIDPFSSIIYKRDKILKPVLSEMEIKSIIETKLTDKKLILIRDIFLFQLFANGMRVSDFLLLKIGNIRNTRISYMMYKTKTNTSLPVNKLIAQILCRILSLGDLYALVSQDKSLEIPVKYMKEVFSIRNKKKSLPFNPPTTLSVSINELDELIKIVLKPSKLKPSKKGDLYEDFNKLREDAEKRVEDSVNPLFIYKGYQVRKSDLDVIKLIDIKSNLNLIIDEEFLKLFQKKIDSMEENKFVFPILSERLFSDLKFNKVNNLDEEQYKNLKHNTIVYNRQLKVLQTKTKVKTNLTSHVARHSYASLLLDFQVNLYDISLSLGHSSLKVTENYLKSGFDTKRIDYLSDKLNDKFSM